MKNTPTQSRLGVSSHAPSKRQLKQQQLVDNAIEALTASGYANSSLRDIASVCQVSLGTLHYYFSDKNELIVYCVKSYKSVFIDSLLQFFDSVQNREQAIKGFSLLLSDSIENSAAMHRLWYDIRNQAMFDQRLHVEVEAISAELLACVRRAAVLTQSSLAADIYLAAIDGLFQRELQADNSSSTRSNNFETLLRSL